MKKNMLFAGLISAVMLFSQAVSSQVISVGELAELIDSGDVIVVSARKTADYTKVHLPGAINIWHKDLYREGDIKALCKSADELATILGSKGISADKTIVVYDSGKSKFAGRVYWILKYMGCKDVRILDGHMKMWRKNRKPVTKKASEVVAVEFAGVPDPSICISMDDVKSGIVDSGTILVDVRDKDEYDGKKGDTERKGHIPGAVLFNFKNVLNEDGTIKDRAELEKAFSDAGITSDKKTIIYCETSVRAGIVYMVLSSILGYPDVMVYDGAMFEWTADTDNLLE